MKAKMQGRCRLCRGATNPGDEIEVFMRKWVHAGCKAAEIARRTEEHSVLKGVTVVPMQYQPRYQLVASNDRIQRRRSPRGGQMS